MVAYAMPDYGRYRVPGFGMMLTSRRLAHIGIMWRSHRLVCEPVHTEPLARRTVGRIIALSALPIRCDPVALWDRSERRKVAGSTLATLSRLDGILISAFTPHHISRTRSPLVSRVVHAADERSVIRP
jgi:hypothetical protein